jgi:hypothetical protein
MLRGWVGSLGCECWESGGAGGQDRRAFVG